MCVRVPLSPHMPNNTHDMSHFSGGSNFVQLFSNEDPLTVFNSTLKLGNQRTQLVVDNNFTTCISRVSFELQPSTWAKIVPHEFYIRRNPFTIYVAGNGFTCSAVGGISVSVQPSCKDNSECFNSVPCTSGNVSYKGGRLVCENHCYTSLPWEFVVVYIGPLVVDKGALPPELCEIWFGW